ncbi:protease pro-enzyme activation domain-containing protein [Bifidobacterium mongoliense]|uniref:protease pro-enzyme activation domain-containing protein n=1 Tax=Bifidobacterium mongoliense TaxID=518643 RepID=UPI0030EB86EE
MRRRWSPAAIPAMATGPLPAASDVGRTVLAGTAPTWAQRTAPTVSRGATSAIVLLKPSATDAERRDVTGWLRSQGIHVDRDRASIHAMSVSGPRAALAHAFDTTFVRQRVSGRTAVVPARALSVPSGLNAVQSVAGLVDTDAAVPTTVAAPQTSDDCAAYWGQKLSADWPASVKVDHRSNALCGYGPQRLRAIHELPQDATGQGATIAIVAAFDDDSVEVNTNTYSAASKMQGFRPRGSGRRLARGTGHQCLRRPHPRFRRRGASGQGAPEHVDVRTDRVQRSREHG